MGRVIANPEFVAHHQESGIAGISAGGQHGNLFEPAVTGFQYPDLAPGRSVGLKNVAPEAGKGGVYFDMDLFGAGLLAGNTSGQNQGRCQNQMFQVQSGVILDAIYLNHLFHVVNLVNFRNNRLINRTMVWFKMTGSTIFEV